MSPKGIWVAGEALIDLVPSIGTLTPTVGGGAANTVKGLAKLGINASFIGGISSDKYGLMIQKELYQVDLTHTHHSTLPTALAIVTLDKNGLPSYEFHLNGTATFDFSRDWLPNPAPDILHIGTLATIVEPGASELFLWASQLNTLIVFDPNIRPSVISDRGIYRKAVERWLEISRVVKVSSEDLEWLGYEDLSTFFKHGADLVIVTMGSSGIAGYTKSESIKVPGVKVEVVDTVGAGDIVGSVLVEGIAKYGLDVLINEKLFEVLTRAAKAAAITCSRLGAHPPTTEELEA